MNRLDSGDSLQIGDELLTREGWARLVLEADGNLVLYRTQVERRLWASNTAGKGVTDVTMEANGDLVAATPQGTLSISGTDGNPGAHAVLCDDANFVVYDTLENPLWRSDTVEDFHTPTIEVVDADNYSYVETSESWKALCSQLPCFTALQWPGYSTLVIDDEIDGETVVIQLWKGWCPQFLGSTLPGGVGAEVGVYRRMRGSLRIRSLPLMPKFAEDYVRAKLGEFTDREFWWPFPELGAELEFTLINPVTDAPVFSAGPETSYWLAKWMSLGSYARYALKQTGRVPLLVDNYILEYSINGRPGRWPSA
jgi:hypothetical protein